MSASETESQFESFRSAIQSEFPPHSDDEPETGTAPRAKGTSQPVTEAVRIELMVKRAELGVRVCEMVLCLISLSVMVADRSRGWSGDSYYRYKEYRYCIAGTFIGLLYSGFQSFALAYNLTTGKNVIVHHLRYHFDFAMDQVDSRVSYDIGIIIGSHQGRRLGIKLGRR
ncbi:CASP-like protein 4A3 isoform X2 [Actinidia eriantha]|uniref:CASP-like protein 4A3 isoform X2 n=1 Tax=Actinidia eriantha TaxID=165200 RepID=UPI002588C238|nr:CASP-like protein 4A3 isoform X2 [Actinidia eriantha]